MDFSEFGRNSLVIAMTFNDQVEASHLDPLVDTLQRSLMTMSGRYILLLDFRNNSAKEAQGIIDSPEVKRQILIQSVSGILVSASSEQPSVTKLRSDNDQKTVVIAPSRAIAFSTIGYPENYLRIIDPTDAGDEFTYVRM